MLEPAPAAVSACAPLRWTCSNRRQRPSVAVPCCPAQKFRRPLGPSREQDIAHRVCGRLDPGGHGSTGGQAAGHSRPCNRAARAAKFSSEYLLLKYREFRGKILDGINPLCNSEPLAYVPSANGRNPRAVVSRYRDTVTIGYVASARRAWVRCVHDAAAPCLTRGTRAPALISPTDELTHAPICSRR
eukprot:COSAG03_NODE_138_length_11785_cov_22.668835_3_plen_187_part_00